MRSGLGKTAPAAIRGNSPHCHYGEAISISRYPSGVLRRRRLGDSHFFQRFMHLASVVVTLIFIAHEFAFVVLDQRNGNFFSMGKMDWVEMDGCHDDDDK